MTQMRTFWGIITGPNRTVARTRKPSSAGRHRTHSPYQRSVAPHAILRSPPTPSSTPFKLPPLRLECSREEGRSTALALPAVPLLLLLLLLLLFLLLRRVDISDRFSFVEGSYLRLIDFFITQLQA